MDLSRSSGIARKQMKTFFLISSHGLEIGLLKLGQVIPAAIGRRQRRGALASSQHEGQSWAAEMMWKLHAETRGELIWRK